MEGEAIMSKRRRVWWMAAVCAVSLMGAAGAWAANLVLKGSTTVLPVAQKVAEEFMKENSDVRISIAGGGSGNGIKALIDATCDVAMSSRFIKKQEVELAVGRGIYPVPLCIAYDCIVPVVHPDNTVTNLSIEQLKNIYKGVVRNWKELGGPDREIVVVSRDTSSGTYEVWEEMVLGGGKVYPGALLQASNGAIVQTVAKNKNAVGYIGIGYANPEVKPLSVNGIVGSEITTLDGSYPISRPLFIFTPGWPKMEAQRFLNYLVQPGKGQKLVREAGFVPLY
jgi:phosphate transport system substrate-binding protein